MCDCHGLIKGYLLTYFNRLQLWAAMFSGLTIGGGGDFIEDVSGLRAHWTINVQTENAWFPATKWFACGLPPKSLRHFYASDIAEFAAEP